MQTAVIAEARRLDPLGKAGMKMRHIVGQRRHGVAVWINRDQKPLHILNFPSV